MLRRLKKVFQSTQAELVIIILHALLKYFFLQDIAMVLVFALGYAGIIFEESLAFNKSGV